jgi:hypothetical protein
MAGSVIWMPLPSLAVWVAVGMGSAWGKESADGAGAAVAGAGEAVSMLMSVLLLSVGVAGRAWWTHSMEAVLAAA